MQTLSARLVLCSMVAASIACADAPEPTPCPGVVDDYAVWNALIGARDSVVVVNETLSTPSIEVEFLEEQGLASQAAIQDLIVKNDVSRVIDEAGFDVAGEVHVLPYADVPALFDQRDPLWQDFSNRYGVGSSWSLSRPGFGCGEAVVYVLSQCGFTCGAGTFSVLGVDDSGDWVVVGDGYRAKVL